MITALAGGVGAARFLRGLLQVESANDVAVVVNTGDDEIFHGLHVSPDLDTVTYTLAEAINPETGWGLRNETFQCLEALGRYGRDTWFRLGDRDLATHIHRTDRLRHGHTLSDITDEIARAWGLGCAVMPMCDEPVATMIDVWTGTVGDSPIQRMAMQEWFVEHRCEPSVLSVEFVGSDDARPTHRVLDAIDRADVVVICPSNPIISIGPILSVPGIRERLLARRDTIVGVSPIIAGATVKGPADRLMRSLGIEVSCVGVAEVYRDFCSTLVIDEADRARADDVRRLGVQPVVTPTLMRDLEAASALARTTVGAMRRR